MPSDKKSRTRGRTAIYNWRVKCGKKEVFSDPQKGNCAQWMRDNAERFTGKLCLIPPNL